MHSVRELVRGRLRPGRPRLGAATSAIDERYFRPTEVDELCGDAVEGRAACSAGGRRTTFHDLVRIMLEADLAEAGRRPATPRRADGPAA